MNILVFAHDASMYGASQSLLTALAGIKNIHDRKILVLLPYSGKFGEELDSLGIDSITLPFPKCTDYKRRTRTLKIRLKKTYGYYKNTRNVLPEIERIIKEFKPDVIYTNTSVVAMGHIIARRQKIPHVWHVREFGDLDYDYVYFPAKTYIKRCIASSKRCIFGSEALRNAWLGPSLKNSHVVYNGIFENEWHFPPKKLPGSSVRLGIVGGIVSGKGQDVAIEAFGNLIQQIPSCSLTLYGDTIDRSYHQKLLLLIKQLNIEEKVSIMGFESDKNKIFDNLDVLLSCSRMEGFGRTIVEAMSRGVPVIGNQSGGIVEIIDDKINGLLYRETSGSLAEAIILLLSNAELYHSLSINGIIKAKQFSIPKYVQSIDRILCDALIHD